MHSLLPQWHMGRCAILAIMLFASPLQAHHSFGLYDEDVAELKGIVVDVSWRNPHIRLTVKVSNENGSEELWTLEGGASYVLKRRGITRELFQAGDTLLVAGRPHTRDGALMLLHNILLENGEEVIMTGGVQPRWSRDLVGRDQETLLEDTAAQNRGLFRTWSTALLRPITYGEDLPYREQPSAGGPQWIERLNGYAQRCEPVGMPGIMATPYPFEFIDNGEFVELLGFSNNASFKRTINFSEIDKVTQSDDGRMGFSVGQWQDEQLFVVTTTLIDWPYFDDTTGTPLSDEAVVTEFLTLSDDQSRLHYRMVIDDRSLFDDPVTLIDTHWAALGEELVLPPDCSN